MKRALLIPVLTLFVSAVSPMVNAAGYCAALRGNGELMPAHWGAMSSLVEANGMPDAMAGGSSATITMFLLESVALNPLFKTDGERALMIKSFQGYFESLSQTSEGKAIASILSDKTAIAALMAASAKLDEAIANPGNKALLAKHLGAIQIIMASPDVREIINKNFVYYVAQTLKMSNEELVNQAVLGYRLEQINFAIKNFGKFDALTDKTLFFRPGLISFEKLAVLFGRMGDFYAGYNLQSNQEGEKVRQLLGDFLKNCAPGSKDLSWRELTQQRPACQQLLIGAVLTYQKGTAGIAGTQSRITEKVGQHIPTFATTSVLMNEAVQDYTNMFIAYDTNSDPNFGDFKVAPKNLRFGYWGAASELGRIEQAFTGQMDFQKDAKSQKFLNLGEASWAKVLSLSPAEPGLASVLAISRTMLSAGGWSDLHPTLVLKAAGCEKVLYVTRKGEESNFAQNVFRRLTGATDAAWSELYDLANPHSSISRAQLAATSIKCTNWNDFKMPKDLNALIEDSMRSPVIQGALCK